MMEKETSFSEKVISFLSDFVFPKEALGRGYEDAFKDATHPDKPLPKNIPHYNHFIRVFSPSQKSELFYQSYKEGYELGYVDGLRKRVKLYENTPSESDKVVEEAASTISKNSSLENQTSMSNNSSSFAGQLDLTEKLIENLENLTDKLDRAQQSYAKKIDQLERAHLMKESINNLRESKHAELSSKVNALIQQVRERDIKYLEALKQAIEEAIAGI
jgi:hypothetical protein